MRTATLLVATIPVPASPSGGHIGTPGCKVPVGSTPAQAAPLLVFCLLYTPCIAAVAAVKRELGGKWATIMVVNQCVVAWVCALLVRLVAVMLF